MMRLSLVSSLMLAAGWLSTGCLPGWPFAPGGGKVIAPTDEVEPNNDVTVATPVALDEAGQARLLGTIPPLIETVDSDFWALGAVVAGDHITVDVTTTAGDLDSMIAVFDADSRLFVVNDKTGTEAGLNNPHVDQTFHRASDNCYLLVARSAFSPRTSGSYEVTVRMQRGLEAPAPRPQTFVLNFAGGDVMLPTGAALSIPPFDAVRIANTYDGKTDTIKRSIVATFRQNYARYNVTTLDGDHDSPPADGIYSTIYFGGYDAKGLGIALTGTDPFNRNPSDSAVVFTDRFTPKLFTTPPTPEQLGTAIGNIAAHEAGHLLGLNHVRDAADLMNTYDAPNNLLKDQRFKRSTLDRLVIPLFLFTLDQDGAALLEQTVGRSPATPDATVPVGPEPTAIAAMRLADDATIDLVAAGTTESQIWLLHNSGNAVFAPEGPYFVGYGPSSLAVADYDSDGKSDLAIANIGDSNLIVLKNSGFGGFIIAAKIDVPNGPVGAAAGHFDRDGKPDLASISGIVGEAAFALNLGDATFGSSAVIGTGALPLAITAADFDRDGLDDIAISNVGSQNVPSDVTVFRNKDDGTFEAKSVSASNGVMRFVRAADVNGDGASDLIVVDAFADGVQVLMNNGSGGFGPPALSVSGEKPEFVAAADLDNDGDLDLVVTNTNSEDVSVLLNRGDGTFAPEWPYRVGGIPSSVAAADFNGDGVADLAVTDQTNGAVAILINRGGGVFNAQAR